MNASTPVLELARRFVDATDNAERSAALGDLYNALVRVEEPAGAPVGDETEALREALTVAASLHDENIRLSLQATAAEAHVAGLEAREAALGEALEQACDWLADDLPEDLAKDDADDHEARHALREWRYVLADSGEAGSDSHSLPRCWRCGRVSIMSVRNGTGRAEKVAAIRAARQEHPDWPLRKVAESLGMGLRAVHGLLNDPDGSKQLARRERYRQPCSGCGKVLDGSNGFKGGSTGLCVTCSNAARREWTAEACVAAAHAWFAEHGRIPNALDWLNAGSDPVRHPAASTIYSWENAPFSYWADFIEACGWPRPHPGRYERAGERGIGVIASLTLQSLRSATEPIGPSSIGQSVGLTRLQVGKALDGLLNRGLVEKVAHGKYAAVNGEATGATGRAEA